jgi:eukaryotic-like serine/threonine-protein kinase
MTFDEFPPTIRITLLDACDQFEAAWKSGKRPRIEDYLNAWTEPERTALLRMLIPIEIELRKNDAVPAALGEYQERFEKYGLVIQDICSGRVAPTAVGLPLTELGSSAPPPDGPPRTEPGTTIGYNREEGESVPEPLTAPRVSPRYHDLRHLGEGNFVVYRAFDEQNCRHVAIKIARPNDHTSSAMMSLAHEADAYKALNHPRIVKLYEYVSAVDNEAGGGEYIVMEYIEGQTLEQKFKDHALSSSQIVAIVAKVADAICHAHNQKPGLIHRDLKPSNILIDHQGEPHVCDFGLAVNENILWQRKGEIAGTYKYMAPEQVRRETNKFDGRTDIWALGVILYRGLTAEFPFSGPSNDAIIEQILHHDPKPLRMHVKELDPELERICLRCLLRPMAERYHIASDLSKELLAALDQPRPPRPDKRPLILPPKGFAPYDIEDKNFFLAMLPGPRGANGLPESLRFWKQWVESTDSDPAQPVGLLCGPSGGGKSSFVRAGLLPRLDRKLVYPIYVEATRTGTEARLLTELRRSAPSLTNEKNLTLPDSLALLRDQRTVRPAAKLLIILDQFEQWLQAHLNDPEAELIQALRHCDGRGVQVLVLIRDDFWTATNGFFQALDVALMQGRNYTVVELFDEGHARLVLAGFGRSLGKLPDGKESGPGVEMANKFLDDAAAGLTDDNGKVVPMRLSLFAQVVRYRDWVPQTLVDLKGVDGIGVKFLKDCFESPTFESHKTAAQAVLNALSPSPISDIRGTPRARAILSAASGYANRPDDFAKLLGVLESELKLITATDREGMTPAAIETGTPLAAGPDDVYYQISHDYLVRPIRRWLELDQTASPEGRARLRLKLITASWKERPGARQLPSPMELGSILWRVPSDEWSADERHVMVAAKQHYVVRATALLALLVAFIAGGKVFLDRQNAATLVEQSVTGDYRNLPKMISRLEPYREQFWTRSLVMKSLEKYEVEQPETATLEKDGEGSSSARDQKKAFANILLFDSTPTPKRSAFLRSLLNATAEPDKIEVIRDSLSKHAQMAGIAELRAALFNTSAEPATRLRAACVLAKLEPNGSDSGDKVGDVLKVALVGEDRRTVPRWVELLEPRMQSVVPFLMRDCRDPEIGATVREHAAEALAEVFARTKDAQELARSIVAAQPDAARILRRVLKVLDGRETALNQLRGFLTNPADLNDTESRKDEVASRHAEAAITLAVLGETEPLWQQLVHRPDPRLRARLIHTLGDSGLAFQVLLDRLTRQGVDPAQRQALLLAAAEATSIGSTPSARSGFVEAADGMFHHDTDPGVHSAAELLLRRFGHENRLARTDEPRRIELNHAASSPGWEVGPNGHTFAILPGPLKYFMGSPLEEDGRLPSEKRHYRRIDRSIEVATKEVTADQFRKYRKTYRPEGWSGERRRVDGNSDQWYNAAGYCNWYDAAGYCNWLSREAKIDKSQWCYPETIDTSSDPEKTPPPGPILGADLKKTGYRLPTEAEWEYFCRAGTETSRPFGGSDALLSRYVWTRLRVEDWPSPPGQLLPNEFGLFDTLGNVLEWCQDGPKEDYQDPYPAGTIDQPASDSFRDELVLDNNFWRYLRGSSYTFAPWKARSAFRDEGPASQSAQPRGFRVVRTLPINQKTNE